MEEFKWELSNVMKDLSPNIVGTLRGSIIAKADKMGVKEAIEFVEEKEKEEMIDSETATRLIKILKHYSTFR